MHDISLLDKEGSVTSILRYRGFFLLIEWLYLLGSFLGMTDFPKICVNFRKETRFFLPFSAKLWLRKEKMLSSESVPFQESQAFLQEQILFCQPEIFSHSDL